MTNQKKIFVQIGAGAGDKDASANYQDGFSAMVKSFDPNDVGRIILVEPHPINFPALKECWKDYPQAEIYSIGIVPSYYTDRTITFYYLSGNGPHYQLTSIKKQTDHPEQVTEFIAPCETLTGFLQRTVGKENVSMLGIDIEGIDGDVILDTDWSLFNVDQISFEYIHLGGQLNLVKEHLEKYGYRHTGKGLDPNGIDWGFSKI